MSTATDRISGSLASSQGWRAAVLAACLWATAGASLASTIDTLDRAPGYVHEVFSVEDGLPRAGVIQALQTRDGFLWLATFDGLVRFDGVHFEVFDSERVPALGSNRIYDLVEGRDGALWIRTEQGHIARYANGVFTACEKPRSGRAACALLTAGAALYKFLIPDAAGNVWVSGPAGIYQASAGELREITGLKGTPHAGSFLHDRTGRFWIASQDAVWTGRPGRLQRIALPPGSFETIPPSLAEDAAGNIWVATSHGTGRIRHGVFTPEPGIKDWGFVVQDGRGGAWLVSGNRLLRSRGRGFEPVVESADGPPQIFPGRHIIIGPDREEWIACNDTVYLDGAPILRLAPRARFMSIARDAEGTVWATTNRGELHALHPARVTTIADGLADPAVYPVYEDRDGTILAGAQGMIAFLAPGARRFLFRPSPAGPAGIVTAFLRDRAGTFWVGTEGGLFMGDRDRLIPVAREELYGVPVRAIYEDSRGILWIGTDTGLLRRDAPVEGGRWSWLRAENGLPFPWVRVIRETADGALWLGTNGGGVIRLKDGRFTAVTSSQGLSSDVVRAIYIAPDGRLWIGTENRGLNRLDPASVGSPGGPRIAVISRRQGLYSSGIHQIVADTFGNLWMSSNQGIFRAWLRDLDAVADGRLARLDTIAYTERDGMRVREANGSVQDAGFRDRAGRLWFPTQHGVVRIDPRAVLRRRRPPQPQIVRLRVGGEEIPLTGGRVRLSPSQRSFAFDFTAPSFLAPERQRFRVRLAPYDRTWTDTGRRREADYTKVPPGRYVFEVLAAGPDGEWSTQPAAVPLEVVPRFYETWVFLLACFLAAGVLFFGAIRLWAARQHARQEALERLVAERTATIAEQAEKLRELDRLKSQFFANVSHELRTPLTLTLGPLRDSLDGRFGPLYGELAGQLGVALRNAERLLGLVDQLLDVARLDAGRLRLRLQCGDLVAYVRQRVETFLPLAERREIDLSLDTPVEAAEVYFDDVQLEKVFDNLLGNALKFTPQGGKVQVTVTAHPERVEVSVRDDGPGIPADQLARVFERFYQVETTGRRWPGAGIGLALARQLVELHRGSISVQSTEGHGACFTVNLWRGRDHLPAELVVEEDQTSANRPSRPGTVAALLGEPESPAGGSEPDPGDDRTTVLVVDDNSEIRAYVRRHLEPDYRVAEAADGAEGLERARSLLPDLVVSDVMMPGLDGNALFRSLRQDPELETVPVVLLTAKASAESRLQGLREGVDDYLVKPFDPRELKARVDNLIASRRRLLERIGVSGTEVAPPRPLRVSEVHVTSADEAFVARVQAAVEERLGDPELTVETLAGVLACDRSYLLRKLRTLTGETPSGLIRSLRLQRAEQLLRAGAGTVSEIAYAVGFKSVAHFSNAFCERYSERPSAFAARHRSR